MRKTLVIMAEIMMVGMAFADFDILYSGNSASVAVNLQNEPIVDDLKIPWNALWIGANANASVVISDNGVEVKRATGAGEFNHVFSSVGRHDLTYVTYISGVAQDEIYEATVFKDWKYEVKDGGAVIIGTTHTAGNVTIPSVIDGYPVTGIATGAFANCIGLTGVTIPTSVKQVEDGAFAGCTSLTQALTLDQQGGRGGTSSLTATYDSPMPSIKVPKRSGYTFAGYWSEKDGEGTQYYTASGASARNCDMLNVTTLYAKWLEGEGFTSSSTYCVIDLAAGANAVSYPVTYMAEPPEGGFNTNEYKTTKLVLRLIEPGIFKMGGSYDVMLTKPFYCGVFEVTQKQYELVMGTNPSSGKGDM